MKMRVYDSYEAYLTHQAQAALDRRKQAAVARRSAGAMDRFAHYFSCFLGRLPKGSHALCLGARRGDEVRVLHAMGLEAIGVDLQANIPWVIEGDFHALPFADKRFDLVFSNAVDHVFDPPRFAAEALRVLRPGGLVLLALAVGDFGRYESLRVDEACEVRDWFPACRLDYAESFPADEGGMTDLLLLRKDE